MHESPTLEQKPIYPFLLEVRIAAFQYLQTPEVQRIRDEVRDILVIN